VSGGALHRGYRGRMVYLTDGSGETGREFFSVTVQPDGERTLRAQCEMDDDRLLRDVLLTVDARWRPRDAFLRLTVDGALLGSAWFRFSGRHAECEAFTRGEGRVSQRFEAEEEIECFGTHALHGDAWTIGRLRDHPSGAGPFRLATFASSILPNGASGPLLVPLGPAFSRVHDEGTERLECPAGTFEARHVRVEIPGVDDFDVWAAGEDCVPVQLRSHGLRQSYQLVELSGDWR
jgi:hypothetical protein